MELQSETHANIQSEEGILNRQIRSIQTEGHFGDIKENEGFRRFYFVVERLKSGITRLPLKLIQYIIYRPE